MPIRPPVESAAGQSSTSCVASVAGRASGGHSSAVVGAIGAVVAANAVSTAARRG